MYLEKFSDIYEYLHEDLQFFLKSPARFKILLSLLESPGSLEEIRNSSGVSMPAVYSNIRLLLEEGLVKRSGSLYSLSHEATLQILSALKLLDSVDVISRFEEIWLDHDISGIPDDLIEDIDWLKDAELVRSTPTDIYRPQRTYRKLIMGSNEVYGASPISQMDLIDIYEGFLEGGVPVELVLTDEIIKNTVLNANIQLLKTAIKRRSLKIRRFRGDLKVAFTVTDRFFSMGLFGSDGLYDQNRDIMSTDRRAIDWGFRLYEYYRERSEKLGVSNFTRIMLNI